jgi:putative ABC transport system permease protein
LMLLAAAGLLTRSFKAAHETDFGFSAPHVVTMRLQLPATQYPMAAVPFFVDELTRRISGTPGVSDVAVSNALPLTGGGGTTDFVPFGHTGEELPLPRVHSVTPSYFDVLGIRLRSGRFFAPGDVSGAARVALVNATLARQVFPGEDPVGRMVHMKVAFGDGDDLVRIVGVVDDVQYGQLDGDVAPTVYLSFAQRAARSIYVSATWHGGAAAAPVVLRQHVAAIDPALAVTDVLTMRERISNAASRTRFGAVLVSVFALLAGVLAVLGIYGVMSSTVVSRTSEVAIRMALGGQRADVLRTVMAEGIVLMAIGIGLGLAGAYATSRLLRAHLFGITAHDPVTFTIVTCALAAAALLAAWIPAMRATRIEPMRTLDGS